MPRRTQGSVYPTSDGYGIRWPEDGHRPHRAGFKTKNEARRWFAANVASRLDRGAPSPEVTFNEFCVIYLERWGADVADSTRRILAEWLAPHARPSALGPYASLKVAPTISPAGG
jgi:hypothetical protein